MLRPDKYMFHADLTAAELAAMLACYPSNTPILCCGDNYVHIHVDEKEDGTGFSISLDTSSLSDLYPDDEGPNKEI